jgi:outer membrane protein assembly factor BamB
MVGRAMWRCDTCGASAARGQRFCGRCGGLLTAPHHPRERRPLTPATRSPSRAGRLAASSLVGAVLVALLASQLLSSVAGPSSPDAAGQAVERPVPEDDGPASSDERDAGGRRDPDIPRADSETGCVIRDGRRACLSWRTSLERDDWAVTTAAGRAVVVTGSRGSLRVLDARTGALRWRSTLDASPVVRAASAAVVVVTIADRTAVFDLRDGTELGEVERLSRAAIIDGTLLGMGGGTMGAWSLDGSPRWQDAIPGPSLGWVTGTGAFLSRPVSVLSDEIVGLDLDDGTPRWTLEVAGRVASIDAAGDATLVTVEDTGWGGAVLLVDEAGEVRAEHPVEGRVAWVVADDDGTAVIVLERSRGAGVLVIEPEQGLARPVTALGDGVRDTWDVAIGAGVVAVGIGAPDPEVVVLGRTDGLIRQRVALDGEGRDLALPGDATVVVSTDRELAAWSLGTGAPRWSLETAGAASVLSQRPLVVYDRQDVFALEPDPARRRHDRLTPGTSGDRRNVSSVGDDRLGSSRPRTS